VRGFLRFLAWFALLVAAFVLIVLPLLLSPLLSGVLRQMGVRADNLTVSVALFDPGLLFGRSRQVTIAADNADLDPARMVHFEVALGDVSYFDRSFATISGELSDVSVDVGRDTVSVTSISVDGPAGEATATARVAPGEVERLVRDAMLRKGLAVDDVRLTATGVRVTSRGVEGPAQLVVHGGALLLDPGFGGPIVMLQPAPSDPWSLTEAWFTNQGLNVSGVVDVSRVLRSLATDAGASPAVVAAALHRG
jgi:hypothetical protein